MAYLMVGRPAGDSIPASSPVAPVRALKDTERVLKKVGEEQEKRNELHDELLENKKEPASVGSASSVSSPSIIDSVGWKKATATVFWVGEAAGEDNGQIHNRSSAWDVEWEKSFGGYDDPDTRCGFLPCGFQPRLNAFYVALPYNDINDAGAYKPEARLIPWFDAQKTGTQLEGRWIEVRAGEVSCFGQWYDVGPFGEDDYGYVFGSSTSPASRMGVSAGIDLSPAVRDCLGLDGLDVVTWRHVDTPPPGPWIGLSEQGKAG